MAAISGSYGPVPGITLSREQEILLLDQIQEIKKTTDENVKQIARQINRPIVQRELTNLLNQAYNDFALRVHRAYDHTPFAKEADMLIPCFKLDFFSNRGLNKEIRQIVILK